MNGQVPKHRPTAPPPAGGGARFGVIAGIGGMDDVLLKQADLWEARARRRIADAQNLYEPESMEYRAMFNGALIYRNCAEEIRALVQASSLTLL